MDLDPLSIIAPARVKVLLLPVGNVRQSRFASFVQRLQQVNVVRLGDVSPDSRPHRSEKFVCDRLQLRLKSVVIYSYVFATRFS